MTPRRSRGVTAVEATVTVILIMGALGAATVTQRQLLHRAKELTLEADLQYLRAAIDFFEARRGRLPETLDELYDEPIGRAKFSKAFAPRRDAQGELVDAFGAPYRYDGASGAVRSQTPGYESW